MPFDDLLRLPAQVSFVQSGRVQFGEEVPGFYIRGDHLAVLAYELKHALATGHPDLIRQHAAGMQALLASAVEPPGVLPSFVRHEN